MTGSTKRPEPAIPFILGVAGGSGSGKTYFAQALAKALGPANCALVLQDNFYFDQSKVFDFDGGSVNFDHPDSIDFSLLAECLRTLKGGRESPMPLYDFKTHSRRPDQGGLKPVPVIIVDGILIFHSPTVRELFDELVFFDTHEALRFQRRLERDVQERGRSPEGVLAQFTSQVKPMHDQYVEPSKRFANTLVKESGDFHAALASYTLKLARVISGALRANSGPLVR